MDLDGEPLEIMALSFDYPEPIQQQTEAIQPPGPSSALLPTAKTENSLSHSPNTAAALQLPMGEQ